MCAIKVVRMPTFKLYDTLGVDRAVSQGDLKKAYRRLAKDHHPDKGGDQEKFKEITHAYDILSDPKKRSTYDQLGDDMDNSPHGNGGPPPGPHPFGDFMFNFFGNAGRPGGNQAKPTKTSPMVHTVTISWSEAYRGVTKKMKITSKHACPSCKQICTACNGKGQITQVRQMGMMVQTITSPCGQCKGIGKENMINPNCATCRGKGASDVQTVVELDIPPGIATGDEKVFPSIGNKEVGMDAGDVVFKFNVVLPNSVFVKNRTIFYKIPVHLGNVLCGVTRTVRHPSESGGLLIDTTQFETGNLHPGKQYILHNKGMPDGHGGYANAIVTFEIDFDTFRLSNLAPGDAKAIRDIVQKNIA